MENPDESNARKLIVTDGRIGSADCPGTAYGWLGEQPVGFSIPPNNAGIFGSAKRSGAP